MVCSGAWTTTYPAVSKPARPAPPGDLQELPGPQDPLPVAVELRQPGEEHRPDRHVDADPEGVGAADDLEQAGLGQLLDEPPVAREHPGVVHADAAAQQAGEGLAEAGPEPEPADPLGDHVALLAGQLGPTRARREQGRGVLDGRRLGEVDDVHRRLLRRHQLLEGLLERRHRVAEGQRHRAYGVVDDRGLAPVAAGEVLREHRDVAERRRHQQELRLGQLEQRDLPGPAAVRLGVEVELVHDDEARRPRPTPRAGRCWPAPRPCSR